MGAPKWTSNEDAMLRQLLEQGMTYDQIADEMKRGRGSVIGRADRLGLRSARADRYNPPHKARKPRAPRPAPPPAPAPEPVQVAPEAPPPAPGSVTVATLQSTHCRWPMGDPGTPYFHFCGASKQPHRSYCDHHHAISYPVPVKVPFKKGVRT